ncbi:hypothetical protein NJB1728e24_01540, partial [Mycobacterium marinum]
MRAAKAPGSIGLRVTDGGRFLGGGQGLD